MKTQTTTSQMYCSSAAMRYAQVLYELNVPKEAIQKKREMLFSNRKILTIINVPFYEMEN